MASYMHSMRHDFVIITMTINYLAQGWSLAFHEHVIRMPSECKLWAMSMLQCQAIPLHGRISSTFTKIFIFLLLALTPRDSVHIRTFHNSPLENTFRWKMNLLCLFFAVSLLDPPSKCGWIKNQTTRECHHHRRPLWMNTIEWWAGRERGNQCLGTNLFKYSTRVHRSASVLRSISMFDYVWLGVFRPLRYLFSLADKCCHHPAPRLWPSQNSKSRKSFVFTLSQLNGKGNPC